MHPLALLLTAVLVPAAWPDVSVPVKGDRLGKDDVVLVAGVGRPFVLPPIPGAAEAATEWYRFFTDGRGVPAERAVLLRDGDVTKESLLQETTRLAAMKRPGGTFWIVFVGHGAPALSGDDGLLLGVDVQPTIKSIDERGLPQKALLAAAGDNVVAVFDACFSGVRSDGSGDALVPGAQATLPVRRAAPPKRVTVLQASEQVAGPLPGHDRPAFSYLLLGAMRGWADDDGDGVVRVADAFAYTKNALTVLVRDRVQVPSLVGPADRIAARLGRRGERGPRLVDEVAAVRPPKPRRTRASTASTASTDTFDRVAAEDAFAKRRLVASTNGFVRGPYATVVDEGAIVDRAARFDAAAANVVRDVAGRHNMAVIGGVGVGAVGVVGFGTVGAASLAATSSDSIVPAIVGGLVGGLLGGIVGIITGVVLEPSEADYTRQSKARNAIADRLNAEERQSLGLGN